MDKNIIILIILILLCIIYNDNYEKFNVGGQEKNNLCSEYCTPNLDKDYCTVLCNKVHDTTGNYMRFTTSNYNKNQCNQSIIKDTTCKTNNGVNTSIPINPIWCPSNCIPTPGYDENNSSPSPPPPTPGPPPPTPGPSNGSGTGNSNGTKYSCSGSKCISGTSGSGSYTTSNCNNKCGFSCNASNICIQGLSGSGSYNTIDECNDICNPTKYWLWGLIIGLIVCALIGGGIGAYKDSSSGAIIGIFGGGVGGLVLGTLIGEGIGYLIENNDDEENKKDK